MPGSPRHARIVFHLWVLSIWWIARRFICGMTIAHRCVIISAAQPIEGGHLPAEVFVPMALSSSSQASRIHRGRRRLVFIGLTLGFVLLIVLAIFLLARSLTPRAIPVLRLAPAAAAVDDQTTVLLTGTGWQRHEDVAICASTSADSLCDAASALTVVQADRQGELEVDVLAGPLLSQGLTTFIATGMESGQVATRSFRILQAANSQGDLAVVGPETPGASRPAVASLITPTLAAPDSGAAAGTWLAEYFANPDLVGAPALTNTVPSLTLNWDVGAPSPLLAPDGFSVRLSRRISFTGGIYQFLADADGGFRLIVDGQTEIDQWEDPGTSLAFTAAVDLSAGEHDVVVEYTDRLGAAAVALRWELLDSFADWRGEYFANPDLSGEPALVRNDGAIEFDWGEASPAPGLVPNDRFSVRWTRTLSFAEGAYRFLLTANDGARVLVDNQAVIEAWAGPSDLQITGDTQLSAGEHQITVLFFDEAGPARVSVGWSPIAVATPAGVAVVPTGTPPSSQPGQPTVTATPTWTPTPPPGSTAFPTQPVNTLTVVPTAPPGSTLTPTPTAPPGSTATPTPTAPPGSTSTPTVTVLPGSTATPTPTITPTVVPGSTATPTPSPTPTATPLLDVGLDPAEARVDQEVKVAISGQWRPGVEVFVILLANGVPIPPPNGQAVSTGASATTSNDGSAVIAQFNVPRDSRLLGTQPTQLVVHTGDWSQWKATTLHIGDSGPTDSTKGVAP